MLPALTAFGKEFQLIEPADLHKAVVGISAEVLVGMSSAEIVARMGGTASGRFVVVFDGPGRRTSSKLSDGLLRRRIMRALVEAEIKFLVAPALAAAQLAHLHEQQLISHVSGSEETWLWADVPLVLDIFAPQPQMLRRQSVLACLRLPPPAFTELLVGFGNNAVTNAVFPPFAPTKALNLANSVRQVAQICGPPPLVAPTNRAPYISDQLAVSLYRAAVAIQDPAYLASLQQALTFVYRQPVMQLDGTVSLLNMANQPLPKDLTDVVGCQLSPVLLYYANVGLLQPEMLGAMVWGRFTDYFSEQVAKHVAQEPGISAQSTALQSALSPLRQQTYALLASTAHRYFQMHEVVVKISGAANFSRRTSAEAPGFSNEATPTGVVNDAVQKLQHLVNLPATPAPELASTFVQTHIKDPQPSSLLIQSTTLAFRQYVEIAVFYLITQHELELDLAKVVQALPFN